jgi:glycosyltransferase involved in cell wall biosynthesis
MRAAPWKYKVLLVILIVVTLRLFYQSTFLLQSVSEDEDPNSHDASLPTPTKNSNNTTTTSSLSEAKTATILIERVIENKTEDPTIATWNRTRRYPSHIFVDDYPPYYRPLQNRFVLGKYANRSLRVSGHDMDAVIMASAPDATLGICIHNLFHLLGFRRFVFVVNNSTLDCPTMFDLVPQHYPERPHVCLDHVSFYSSKERERIQNEYPGLHRGAPGKLQRGDKFVQVPRMGWYLQQFSKLLIPMLVPDLSKHYLAIDGDLVFTRPYHFTTTDGKNLIMPTTSKSPKHWRYFVDWIFDWKNETNDKDKDNFVVGWMPLDQTIVQDLIGAMNQNIPGQDVFPFNILNQAEQVINQTFFSEFYVYARYALRHSSNPYVLRNIKEPARNPGKFQWTCVLRQSTYEKAQTDLKLAPFLIWEEHKQHAFHACPNDESVKTTTLSNIGIWHDFHPPPWGGGNQFLLALRSGLEDLDWRRMTVVAKSDPDGKQVIQNTSQVLLANSITFKGSTDVLEELKEKHNLALVHRVDGPYYVARYFEPLNFTSLPKLPTEDKRTKQINRNFACATVFQSQWSLEANIKIGLGLRNPVVIPNTVNPAIFYSVPRVPLTGRRIKIVATSHSSNVRKGFDTMMWIDANLDYTRFEFVYMGGLPKTGFGPLRNVQIAKQAGSESVADFLRSGDIYFAPSRYEPASNAVMEALACGLPVLYQEGSSHGDLVGAAGLGFASTTGPELLRALDEMVENYETHVQSIHVPSIEEVSKKYLSIMRWCFYMKHLMF